MSWVKTEIRPPKKGQWVAVPFGTGFRVGRFNPNHPMGPAVLDPETGRWCTGFTHWKPLSPPKL